MVQVTSHIDKIKALGNKIVDNLEAQGVSASFDDGAITLADKILDIKPFTTTISLDADNTSIKYNQRDAHGQPIVATFQGTLKAQYSDSSININTPMQNETIIFRGNDIQDRSITTNTDGYFSTSIQIGLMQRGTYTYQAFFEGSSFYPVCESSTVVVTIRKDNIDITDNTSTNTKLSVKLINVNTNEALASQSYSLKVLVDNLTSPLEIGKEVTNAEGYAIYEDPYGLGNVHKWIIVVPETDIHEGKTIEITP